MLVLFVIKGPPGISKFTLCILLYKSTSCDGYLIRSTDTAVYCIEREVMQIFTLSHELKIRFINNAIQIVIARGLSRVKYGLFHACKQFNSIKLEQLHSAKHKDIYIYIYIYLKTKQVLRMTIN